MKEVKLGKTQIRLTAIVMGMWQAGKQYWSGISDQDILGAIDAAMDAGVTTFDTAEEYGDGHSEQLLGKGLRGRRDKAVILTKVFSNHLKHQQVIDACHRSLANLGTDYIDLYQIHWPSGSWGSDAVPIQETMGALTTLQKQGKIRAIGVSNFSVAQLEEAQKFGRVESLQSPYSLLWRHIEREHVPYCRREGMSVLAYSPLSHGILTGKFSGEHRFNEDDNRRQSKLAAPENLPRVTEAVKGLEKIAKRKGATLPQLALAWVARHERTVALAGVRNRAQILDNAQAGILPLSDADLREMEAITAPISDKFLADPVPWFWNP